MSARSKEFISLLPATEKRPSSQFKSPHAGLVVLRDNFELPTWLSIGALLQGVLFLALGRLSLIPVTLFVLYQVLDAFTVSIGLRRNTYMDGVITKKTAVVFPNEEGNFGTKPSNSELVVFHIGVRYNHPLGMFSTNASQIAGYFVQMVQSLEDHAEEFNFLGAASYSSLEAASKNEIMTVCYFRTVEGLHKFAHSEYHLPQWQWFNKEIKNMPHISIFHETYHVPAGNWENIHINSRKAGLGATVFKVSEEMTGKEVYTHPIVDASKGLLKTSAGRMARSQAGEHDKILDVDPYDV